MNNILIAFFLTLIAGLSTMLGCFIILFKKKNQIIAFSLSFAASTMFFISILSLIPESLTFLSNKPQSFFLCFIFICIGMIVSYILEKLSTTQVKANKLYKIGILLFITIIIHNIPEGIITFFITTKSIKLGISMAFAIMMHNIPEGISISLPIYYSNNNKKKAIIYTFIAGISEVIGALIAYLFLKDLNNNLIGYIFAITAGIMIHVSLNEVLPEAINYKYYKLTLISILIGLIVVTISILL